MDAVSLNNLSMCIVFGASVPRVVNPYYPQLVAACSGDCIVCFLGGFIDRLVAKGLVDEHEVRFATRVVESGRGVMDVKSVVKEALRECGVNPERVEEANLLHVFYNSLRYMGVLEPTGEVAQASLCKWLSTSWREGIEARLSRIALEALWLHARLRGLRGGIRDNLLFTGAVLMLNLLVDAAERFEKGEPVQPALLTSLAVVSNPGCIEECAGVLALRVGARRETIASKLYKLLDALYTAIEAARRAETCNTIYYCSGRLLCDDKLVEALRLKAESLACSWCREALGVCRYDG